MKKLIIGTFLGIFALLGVAVLPNYTSAQTDWANPKSDTNEVSDGSQTLTGSSLLGTIKNTINWILGILATIALVICLYGGFKMITSAGDEKKYGDGLKVLKNAAIGLAIIGLSWMIVSVVFWFIGTLGKDNQTKGSDTGDIGTNNGVITNTNGDGGSNGGSSNNGGTELQPGRQGAQGVQGRQNFSRN